MWMMSIIIKLWFSMAKELGYQQSNSGFLKGSLLGKDYLAFAGSDGSTKFETIKPSMYINDYSG